MTDPGRRPRPGMRGTTAAPSAPGLPRGAGRAREAPSSASLPLPPGAARFVGPTAGRVADLTLPWANTTRTVLVRAAGGKLLVVQWGADRAAIARRIRLARTLARVAPALPVPPVVAGDASAKVPWLATPYVPGTPGRDLLRGDAEAARLGAAVGGLARALRSVPPTGLLLPRRWAEPVRLQTAARDWLARARDALGADLADRLGHRIEAIPAVLDAPPVFAHGDLAPVNVVLRGGEVVALLDLERARLAHPLYDAAWWTWVIRVHHPERAASAGDRFLEAAGLGPDRETLDRLALLAALQCLEMLAARPRGADPVRREWARRVALAVQGFGPL